MLIICKICGKYIKYNYLSLCRAESVRTEKLLSTKKEAITHNKYNLAVNESIHNLRANILSCCAFLQLDKTIFFFSHISIGRYIAISHVNMFH